MLALTLSLLLANTATATVPPALDAARHAHYLALTAELARSSSPRDWALSTRVVDTSDLREVNTEAQGALLRKAAEAAPADRLVQWMWANNSDAYAGCSARHPCPDRRFAVAKLEPDNAAGWMMAFPKASEGTAVGEEYLHRIAQLRRYHEPTIEAWIAWTDFHREHPTPPSLYPEAPVPKSAEEREAMTIITGIAHASAMVVPLQDLFRFCSRKNHPKASESRFRDCDKLGQLMVEQAPSTTMHLMGLGLRRAASVDPEALEPAQRAFDWRTQQYIALSNEWEAKPRELLAFYRDIVATGSEIRAQELALARAGIPLEPPADWKSPSQAH